MVYSIIESALKYKIETKNKIKEFNNYKKQHERASLFQYRLDFLMSENNYELELHEEHLINNINTLLRSERNKIMHDFYAVFTYEDAKNLLNGGKNIESKLYEYYNWYVKEVCGLFFIVKSFFSLCEHI